MARYIDAEALIGEIKEYAETYCSCGDIDIAVGIGKTVEVVANAPTADVAPVEWISVEDRLPEPESDVLLYSDGRVTHGHYSEWLKTFTAHALEVPRVTHWTPLPEPPKMKEGE